MTTRERWIVYPLLFLTLGIAMRNQFLPTRTLGAVDLRAGDLTAHKIVCDQLVVQQSEECNNLQANDIRVKRVLAGYSESIQAKILEGDFGKIAVTDKQGKPVVILAEDENTKSGAIQTLRADGVPQVQILSNGTGGLVTTFGRSGQVWVRMGNEGQQYGVYMILPQIGQIIPLTARWPIQIPGVIPKLPPEEKKEEPKPEEPKKEQ